MAKPITLENIDSAIAADLRAALTERGLSGSGNRGVLYARLREALATQEAPPAEEAPPAPPAEEAPPAPPAEEAPPAPPAEDAPPAAPPAEDAPPAAPQRVWVAMRKKKQ